MIISYTLLLRQILSTCLDCIYNMTHKIYIFVNNVKFIVILESSARNPKQLKLNKNYLHYKVEFHWHSRLSSLWAIAG